MTFDEGKGKGVCNREFVNRKIFLHRNASYIKVLDQLQKETFPSDNVNGELIKDFCVCLYIVFLSVLQIMTSSYLIAVGYLLLQKVK